MAAVDTEHMVELPTAEDKDPVEALVPERPHPALGMGVGVRRPDRRAYDPDALALEDSVELAAELAVAIVHQKAERLPVAEVHDQVARLLCDPSVRQGCWCRRRTRSVAAPAR